MNTEPLIAPVSPDKIQMEIDRLAPSDCLFRRSGYEVWCSRAENIPAVLREIGRLREESFRAAGEGTGKCVDIDRFDIWYRHLFLWHAKRKQIVGAYRLGLSEEIYPRYGLSGFYTYSLFDYGNDFIKQLSPGIELGRSFVRGEDQRSFLPLFLLWKGIALLVSRMPSYRRLFGPVSISAKMPLPARRFLAESLLMQYGAPSLSAMVSPRHPMERPHFNPHALAGIAQEDQVRHVLNSHAPGMKLPVLLRHYLALNGKLIAFSLDHEFNEALDGLILVDLDQVVAPTLRYYMGAEEAKQFEKYLGNRNEDIAARESTIA